MSESRSFAGWIRRLLGWEDAGESDALVDDSGNVLNIPNRYKMCLLQEPASQQQSLKFPERDEPSNQMLVENIVASPTVNELNQPIEPNTSTTPSKQKLVTNDRNKKPQKLVIKKRKKPNVLTTASASDDQANLTIPGFSVMEEYTADKISKILTKLDNLEKRG